MIKPVALGERIFSLLTSVQRLERLVLAIPPEFYPDPEERKRALEEARMVQNQHEAFEKYL